MKSGMKLGRFSRRAFAVFMSLMMVLSLLNLPQMTSVVRAETSEGYDEDYGDGEEDYGGGNPEYDYFEKGERSYYMELISVGHGTFGLSEGQEDTVDSVMRETDSMKLATDENSVTFDLQADSQESGDEFTGIRLNIFDEEEKEEVYFSKDELIHAGEDGKTFVDARIKAVFDDDNQTLTITFLEEELEVSGILFIEFTMDPGEEEGGEEGGEVDNAPVSFMIRNADKGTVYYKIEEEDKWQKVPADGKLNADLGEEGILYFRAEPNEGADIDETHTRIMINGEEHDMDIEALVDEAGVYVEYDADSQYSIEIEFRDAGQNPGKDPQDPIEVGDLMVNVRVYKDIDHPEGPEGIDNAVRKDITSEDAEEVNITSMLEEANQVLEDGETYYVSIEPLMRFEDMGCYRIESIAINGKQQEVQKRIGRNTYKMTYASDAEDVIVSLGLAETNVYTIMWANDGARTQGTDFDNDETKIINGSAWVYKVYDNKDDMNDISDTIEGTDGTGCVDEKGLGYIKLEAGNVAEFRFVPKYGYQLVKMAGNDQGEPADAVEMNAQKETNVYRFVMPHTNVHFSATFAAIKDEVKASATDVKASGNAIVIPTNEIEEGTMQLSVKNASLSTAQKTKFKDCAAELGYEIYSNLSIDLDQVFYKGANDSDNVWKLEHNTLSKKANITLALKESAKDYDVVFIHEKHDGTLEEIATTVNDDGTVSFMTDSFSNYVVVRKANGEASPQPSASATPTASATPAASAVPTAPATQAPTLPPVVVPVTPGIVTPVPSQAPAVSTDPVTNTKPVTAKDGEKVTTTKSGEATLTDVKASSKKSITLKGTVVVNSVSYNLTAINAGAFMNAKKATTVTLPDTIKEIKSGAFRGSKVATVNLKVKKGANLKIAKGAFASSKVKKVVIAVSKKETDKNVNKLKNAVKKVGVKNVVIKKK